MPKGYPTRGQYIEGIPAYGRDYPNVKAVKAAWSSGKDFQDTVTGAYFNKQDASILQLNVIIRYNNQKRTVEVNVPKR